MNNTKTTSAKLMEEAATYYLNLKLTGAWKTEISKHLQIIALTTQIAEMESKISNLAIAKTGAANRDTGKSDGGPGAGQPGGAGGGRYVFQLWRLEKVNNNANHNMVERDGKTWYWCDKHTYNNKGKECMSSTSPVSMMLGKPRKIVSARGLPKKFHLRVLMPK